MSAYFNVNHFLEQFIENLQQYGVLWIIVPLSSPMYGDRYLAPHSVLTTMNRGSTPKWIPPGVWYYGNLPIEEYPDRDLFGEIIDAFRPVGIKIIAYISAQGPAMLFSGENRAYDYKRRSAYVNSCIECPTFQPWLGCNCAPSVHKWTNYVREQYGGDDIKDLKLAFSEVIVQEYAERYGTGLSGFMFDNGQEADMYSLYKTIRKHNKKSAIAFNKGPKMPLQQNAYPYEDFTFGYPLPFKQCIPSDCDNFSAIQSVERTSDGFLYLNGRQSLGHVFTSVNSGWNVGHHVWNIEQAREWQSRVINANGAWTWAVRRGQSLDKSRIHKEDIKFLKGVYEGLSTISSARYRFNC